MKERGFTLIELMAVLAVPAIIAIIAVPSINNLLKNAGDDSDKATLDMIAHAAGVKYADDGGGAVTDYTVHELIDGGYLDYNNTAEGAFNDKVVHQGDGIFQYARPNLLKNTADWGVGWFDYSNQQKHQKYGRTWVAQDYNWRLHQRANLTVGETYTFSYKTYTDNTPNKARVYTPIRHFVGSDFEWITYYKEDVAKDGITNHTITFTAKETIHDFYILADSGSQKIYFSEPKLEVGTFATAYTP